MPKLLTYNLGVGVEAFSSMRDAELPYPVLQMHQTHGINVAVIDSAGITREDLQDTDAMVTNIPGLAIGARTADCIPVLLYDPVRKAVAAIHAGWKGTVRRICRATIDKMTRVYGTTPTDLVAQIGPGISRESFQVGPDVVARFREEGFPMESIAFDDGEPSAKRPLPKGTQIDPSESPMNGGLHIDLWQANRFVLEEAGVKPENISIAGICTYLRNDLFYSARRETIECGRVISSIRLKQL